jgi:sugar lactone lactonase YvrE
VDVLAATDVVSTERAVLGESPRWDDLAGRLYWVDVDRGEVWTATLSDDADASAAFRVPAPLGALVLHEDGGLLWSVGDTWSRPGEHDEASWSLGLPHLRFNDAGVDVEGVVWSGTMRRDETMPTPGQGALYRLDGERAVAVERGLVAGNGIAWSPDEEWMYVVDSGPGTVRRTRFAAGAGPVGGWTQWLTLSTGMPDGIATDLDGGVWVACWGSGQVARFDHRGAQTHRLTLPTPTVTAVAFAGPGLDVLVCTTSSQEVGTDDDPLAGRVFATQSPVPGTPLHRAAGW